MDETFSIVVAGIEIIFQGKEERSKEEALAYLNHITSTRGDEYLNRIDHIYIDFEGDDALLEIVEKKVPLFERIRRITGYLVGTTDRWNNAKSTELEDRVNHSV